MLKIALLGSTGSIGRQVLSTVRRHSDKFQIVSMTAFGNAELFESQINEFKPKIAGLINSENATLIKCVPYETTLYCGKSANMHAIADENVDMVFVAISGFAGLNPTLEALKLKKKVALANKESLVAGGELVMKMVKDGNLDLIPVDSEHSAIFQCLNFNLNAKFKKLILTASGGAFRDYKKEEIEKLKASDALKHPNWQMGKKITIDCATLLNKGLEVIEACRLYNAPLEKVQAVVHKESIVHSLVEFDDGAIMGQMGVPSMELPIQLALTYPERLYTGIPALDLIGKTLHFDKIDEEKFPCFSLALKSYEMGDNFPCAMNGANEEAVKLYLQDKIKFYDIADIISYVLGNIERVKVSEDSLEETDKISRELANKYYGEKLGAL